VLARLAIGVFVLVAIALAAAFVARASWIKTKIAALSSPPSTYYTEENKGLSPKDQRLRVVLIGDSRIARWPTSAIGDQFEVINRGIGGETVAQMARRFDRDAIALKPDVVMIESGMNDLVAASFMDSDAARAVIRQTTQTLLRLTQETSASGAHVLLATIIPPARPELLRWPVWNNSVRAAVAEANGNLRRAVMPDGARLIDLSAPFTAGDDRFLPDEFRLDALHLNQAGYDRLTELLLQNLRGVSSGRSD
jgi:lysophospholipase L1-like esterase